MDRFDRYGVNINGPDVDDPLIKETLAFYMVFSPQKGPTSKRHYNFENAIEEAHRLAKKEVGCNFYVLETVKMYKAEMPVNEYDMEA